MLPRTAAFAALALALAPNAPLRAQMEYPTYVEAKVDDTPPDIAVDLLVRQPSTRGFERPGDGEPLVLRRPGAGYTLIEISGVACRECQTSIDSVVALGRRLPRDVRFLAVWWGTPARTWDLLAPHRPWPFRVYVGMNPNSIFQTPPIVPVPMLVLVDSLGVIRRQAVGEAPMLALLREVAERGPTAAAGAITAAPPPPAARSAPAHTAHPPAPAAPPAAGRVPAPS